MFFEVRFSQYDETRGPWKSAHLSDDEAVAKMGHPDFKLEVLWRVSDAPLKSSHFLIVRLILSWVIWARRSEGVA